eukprot:JP438107.1.p1 GENE.JP438107.1~~JP438107.1.p1  ORF type:complete len:115 (+),score=22.07 JP438107.1:30-374(+)
MLRRVTTGVSARNVFDQFVRHKADKGKPATIAEGQGFDGKTIRVNVFKDQKDPEVLPDSEYPSWLFDLINPAENPSLKDLNDMDYVALPLEMKRRSLRLDNRQTIRKANEESTS